MTFYEKEINRIKGIVYYNQTQIDAVIAVRHFINQNFETRINLDVLSENQFISKYHLLRLFKRYYGLTPRQCLIDKRIEKSKILLTHGLSVTETCFAVGFKSLGSFSVLFKNKTGKAPVHFQKEQLSRSNNTDDY